ncbi:hypothetical protein H6790_00755 [Candidatus Nomurabacteria bacterium]|nr:hypothetical protein [Candidatus Nomurabacteria bacterium]MCB9820463.1 hypothetical protein [Candidatus Nomurabacteria bacterium]
MKILKIQKNIAFIAFFAVLVVVPVFSAEAKMKLFSGGFTFGGGDEVGVIHDVDFTVTDEVDVMDISGGVEDDYFPPIDTDTTITGDGVEDDWHPPLDEEDIDTPDYGWTDAGTSHSYAPYCGDGIINQPWEMCDSTSNCTNQCQNANSCTDLAFARVNIDSALNIAPGNVTADVFLANNPLPIPSGTWFLIYDGANWVDDPYTESVYKPWKGLVVERMSSGQSRIMLPSYGLLPGEGFEHVDGSIEYFGTTAEAVTNDESGDNKVEKMTDGISLLEAGNDEVNLSGGIVKYWLTIGHNDDTFFVRYGSQPKQCDEVIDNVDIGGPVDLGDENLDNNGGGGSHNNNDDDDDNNDSNNEGGVVLGSFIGPDATLAQTSGESTIVIALGIISIAAVFYIQSRRKKLSLKTINF